MEEERLVRERRQSAAREPGGVLSARHDTLVEVLCRLWDVRQALLARAGGEELAQRAELHPERGVLNAPHLEQLEAFRHLRVRRGRRDERGEARELGGVRHGLQDDVVERLRSCGAAPRRGARHGGHEIGGRGAREALLQLELSLLEFRLSLREVHGGRARRWARRLALRAGGLGREDDQRAGGARPVGSLRGRRDSRCHGCTGGARVLGTALEARRLAAEHDDVAIRTRPVGDFASRRGRGSGGRSNRTAGTATGGVRGTALEARGFAAEDEMAALGTVPVGLARHDAKTRTKASPQ
mmetsp:Transcript_26915/g.83280  ORF Transcript_26915/g.83280 Transcript_26915/m.83280 type:complete len:298 (-) Transcript_26915:16-909(-)